MCPSSAVSRPLGVVTPAPSRKTTDAPPSARTPGTQGRRVNYYSRHLGDYARDTAHLSLLEHGAYTLLLDRYYATERGIPDDQVHRLVRARTPAERAAVDSVLSEFFTLSDGLWINKRADAEIASAQVKIAAARRNGRNGGRPRNNPNGRETETEEKPSGLLLGSVSVTQEKALQSPISNLQSPNKRYTQHPVDISSAQTPENPVSPTAQPPPGENPVSDPPKKREQATGTRLPVDWYLSQELGEWALAEGLTREQIRVQAERFRDYWISKPGAGGRKADWAATWRNWIRRSTETGGNSNGKNQHHDRPRSAVDRVNAAISARAREREQREALQRGGRIFNGDGVTMAPDD